MIKYVILAFVAISSLQLVALDEQLETPQKHPTKYEQPSYKFQMRKRLGHFSLPPFVEVYKHYAFAFNRAKDPNIDVDDYKNFVVTANECRKVFAKFHGRKYELQKLESLIPLDGCLGYIMDKDEIHKTDPDSSDDTKYELEGYRQTKELQDLYSSKIDLLSPKSRTCIADLLFSTISARAQFRGIKCNNHILQMYIQFAECQSKLKEMHKLREKKDPYLKIIYDLVGENVRKCFRAEIRHLDNQMKKEVKSTKRYYVPERILKKAWKKGKQRNWTVPVVNMLLAMLNLKTGEEISLREALKLVTGVDREDERSYARLLENIGAFVTKKLNPRITGDPSDDFNEEENFRGEKTYTGYIDDLCRRFRSTDRKSQYDYALSLMRIVRLLKHENVFGISKSEFVEALVTEANESSAVYACTAACNLLTYTDAVLQEVETKDHGKKYVFEVSWKVDLDRMIVWPGPENI